MSEEQQQTISQILRAAREERGLDIDTVYRETSISLPVLNGMENDRFDIIEPVFSRMALLSYADYLGLDPAPLLARFDQENGPVAPPMPETVIAPEKTTPGPRLPLPLDSVVLRTIGLGLGALVILLLAISLFDGSDSAPVAQTSPPEPTPAPTPAPKPAPTPPPKAQPAPPTPAPETRPAPPPVSPPAAERPAPAPPVERSAPIATETTPAAQDEDDPLAATDQNDPPAATEHTATPPATVADPAPPPATTETSPPPAPTAIERNEPPALSDAAPSAFPPSGEALSSGVVLSVEAVDSTWVQIRWDGTGKFEGIVPRGERRSWQATDHFLVLSGRAHGLRYWLGEELLGDGQLGDATKVLRFRATTDGIEFLGPDFQPLTGDDATAQP